MENDILVLDIKKETGIIPDTALYISNIAKKIGLSERKAYYLCFVLETVLEIRMNEISDDSTMRVKIVDNGRYFKFSITDLGKPYILTKNQQAILKRKIVDKYSFEQNGRNGQCFSMLYYYDSKPIQPIAPTIEEQLLDEDFYFRKLKNDDEDIISAINCLYTSYGFEYYHQHLYSVENFKKYYKSGRYIPIIGENQHKQKMCYCALDENTWFESVPELSNLVTCPIARGKGLATKMFKKSEEIAFEQGYEGIHVSAVAHHPYTQKMCNKFGYTPSAIEYSINPPISKDNDRTDCVIAIKIFNKTKMHNIYVDKTCNDLINYIFSNEKLVYEIYNKTEQELIDVSDINYIVDADTQNCFVKIDVCSQGFEQEITDVLTKEEVKNMDVITINLNMNHPNAINGYRILKSKGFICAGTIMGPKNGDYLILQSFRIQPDLNKIVLEDNYKELQKKLNAINIK